MDDYVELLSSFVAAYDEVAPQSGRREPILLITSLQVNRLMHHALRGADRPEAPDEATLELMNAQGWIDIEYTGSGLSFVPTPSGRSFLEAHQRIGADLIVNDISGIIAAVRSQSSTASPFTWGPIREILISLKSYWESAGFPATGLALPPVYEAVAKESSETDARLLSGAIRRLYDADYLDTVYTELQSLDGPAEVRFTEKTFQAVDGWPGASNTDLAEALLDAVSAAATHETDSEKKGKLDAFTSAARDIGVETLSEVLAKVALGGV
ncbi:MAG: hypothetical protein HYX29_02525 [Solirubrobacterales bacterium]|nr:hypothetical protein [Solirubrobacterales bacterium]